MAGAVVLGEILLRERQEASRRLDLVAVDDHGAVVQGRLGNEDALDELIGDVGVERNAAVDDLLGQIAVGEHNERARVALGKTLHRLDDARNILVRTRADCIVLCRLRPLDGMHALARNIPDDALDLHAEQQQEEQRHQHDEDIEQICREMLGKERDHARADEQKHIERDQLFGVVLIQRFEYEVDEQEQKDRFDDDDPVLRKVRKDALYALPDLLRCTHLLFPPSRRARRQTLSSLLYCFSQKMQRVSPKKSPYV